MYNFARNFVWSPTCWFDCTCNWKKDKMNNNISYNPEQLNYDWELVVKKFLFISIPIPTNKICFTYEKYIQSSQQFFLTFLQKFFAKAKRFDSVFISAKTSCLKVITHWFPSLAINHHILWICFFFLYPLKMERELFKSVQLPELRLYRNGDGENAC